jgi:hypothetical protein
MINSWIAHVKRYSKEHNVPYNKAIKMARATYGKKGTKKRTTQIKKEQPLPNQEPRPSKIEQPQERGEGNMRAQAFKNAESVMSPSDAEEFVTKYLQDPNEVHIFNQSFPYLTIKYLSGLKMVSPSLMNTRWQQFKQELILK